MIINGTYMGLYIFMEKSRLIKTVLIITKLTTLDNTFPNLSGGYLTKADKNTGGDPVAWTMFSYNGYTNFLHENPKPNDITSQQHSYINGQFTSLQNVMVSQNASISNGFPSIIDLPSFIDFIIINELASNADAYQFSTYFHKPRMVNSEPDQSGISTLPMVTICLCGVLTEVITMFGNLITAITQVLNSGRICITMQRLSAT
ncbi:MAG: hypothetical protein HC905_10780 [Bacteroidales bacterium]|nr:hypothetical protein [Bacteroidales bacterium]